MWDELILRHCSPTLAGIKTGNMFSCSYKTKENLFSGIRDMNKRIRPKGLRMVPLKTDGERALLYLFRPLRLRKDLCDRRTAELLSEYGYTVERCEYCVAQLCRKLRREGEFPHEVGFFLGYPPEDVIGFIENKAACAKCTGCWKVYGDAESAQRTFERYRRCTEIYCSQWEKGKSLERLIIADKV